MKDKLEHIPKGRLLVALYVLLFIFLIFTDPQKLPVLFLIVPIVWLWACLSLTIYLVIRKLPSRKGNIPRNDIIYSVVIATFMCLILLLRSVNQLNGKDIVLVVILFLVTRPYLRRLLSSN
jgi:cobalamin synthase